MTFRVLNFINADLIAGGLSPLKPELAAIAAGRLVLKEIVRLVEARSDFAFEIGTTCCGPYPVQGAARRAQRARSGCA
jgi:predicted ABC-type ATPase